MNITHAHAPTATPQRYSPMLSRAGNDSGAHPESPLAVLHVLEAATTSSG